MKKDMRFASGRVLMLAVLLILILNTGTALADRSMALHLPEAGGRTQSDGSMTIDYTHMDQGYVMIRAKKTDKRIQLQVSHGSDALYYEINGDGMYEIIPLQFGNGEYRFSLRIAQSRNSSRAVLSGTITLECSMKDVESCFLYPNQYVNYSEKSPVIEKARELCGGLSEPTDIVEAVFGYIISEYDYDWTKYNVILSTQANNMLPDIDAAWENKVGICQDLSALMCAMLRSQGVPAKLVIGRGKGTVHAWVEITIDGEKKCYDPTNKKRSAKGYKAERYY